MKIKVLFADDHEVFHECIKALFQPDERIQVVATAGDGRTAVRLAKELKPDVVVMDLSMPLLNGIEATQQILAENSAAKVLALSSHKDRKTILSALKAGARGYVVKEAAIHELLQAIEAVASGRMYLSTHIIDQVIDTLLVGDEEAGREISPLERLSSREREILQLLAEGRSARDIANLLSLSPKTVESHRQNLMQKLRIDSYPDLVRFAIREGLIAL
ncbi:response regulator [Geoalkalibacter halelectricus]|uniref:Response regulator transcription factor n=1 Tax=Geoalkalibacter halelectricus TaxID=2847045 RepID=A0ABY5ZQJ5_9BACT|nr:response regulator transcription factor [Geoalkalibacter halelectricus]MDO3377612.1 response regulator transcription factor [Geoalkalibacter halelectricus]UWZ81403.1 response regulator transcription factor [Geoalkalibacter halelectricus]